MNISNETSVVLRCRNGTITEMDGNGTDFFQNGTSENITECLPTTEDGGMQLSEMLTVAITSGLGIIGIVLNIAILVITFQRKLIKKDYRMIYYMFITTGDLLFAINSLFVGINIAFQDVYIFKLFGVCLTLMLIFGVIAYEWSAICIILLLVDLVRTIKNPFSDNMRMKTFSKIGCVWTFFIGIILAVGPFLYWNDTPYELPFCSIGNLYGKRLDVYHYEAVIVLSTLVSIMILVSGILLFEIYRSHAVSDSSVNYSGPVVKETKQEKKSADRGKPINRDTPEGGNDAKCHVISIDVKPQGSHCEENNVGELGEVNNAFDGDISIEEMGGVVKENGEKGRAKNIKDGTSNDGSHVNGEVNGAFVGDLGDIVADFRDAKAKRIRHEYKGAKKDNQVEVGVAQASGRDIRRREFIRSCRTVGFFMAAYLGCCSPYLIWSALGTACGTACSDNDRPETRIFRALVATALYLLPIIDPILYTRRFDIFKKASVGIMKKFCLCEKERHSEVTAF